jgi:hypothetical protein
MALLTFIIVLAQLIAVEGAKTPATRRLTASPAESGNQQPSLTQSKNKTGLVF